ncbi:MAG: DUF3098 domain-containing protein [Clostridium sp.]|nr:DUF3098 domain-containing protein [Clostridium sp.]
MEQTTSKTPTDIIPQAKGDFVLQRTNIIVMVVSALLIVAGFCLMAGSPSTETEFNPDIFSTRRIVVGPTLSFIGFVAMAIGIIAGNRRKNKNAE